MTYKPSPEEKLRYFGRVDCMSVSKLSGKVTHCPCWPEEDCCYCGASSKEKEK